MLNDLKEKFMGQPDGEAPAPAEGKFGALSSKLEGFDKKRLYTAFVALVIAGAAGHFMQRTASGGSSGEAMTASVQPSVIPAALTTAQAPTPATTPATTAATTAATPVVQATDLTAPATPVAGATPVANTTPDQAPVVAQAPTPVQALVTDPDQPVPAELASAAPMDAAPAYEEVTRAADPDMSGAEDVPPTFTADTAPSVDPIEMAALTMDEVPPTYTADTSAEPLDACAVIITATPLAAAMVSLSVEAPCNSAEDVHFVQDGLRFSEQLGPDGSLDLMVPAMSDLATFTATFEDGSEHYAQASVPDFGAYERVAVVWKGSTGLQLHALENGAAYGEPGHVWAEAPAMPNAAIEGKGGFVSVLGSTAEGYAADVYTYPTALTAGIEPDVSVEAQVMENTCGQKIEGVILRSNSGRAPTLTDLTMAVPGCDAVGEYLVLKNLPQDLKIARN